MTNVYVQNLFNVDKFAVIMLLLVLVLGVCVYMFSTRYMSGDRKFYPFLAQMGLLLLSVSLMLCADNLALLFILWSLCNTLLVRLMIHKDEWAAAKASGILASKNFLLGASCLLIVFAILFVTTGTLSLSTILQLDIKPVIVTPVLILIILAAMTQSAIWPFHKWLLSSLNSPTPVSAIMHAGLVNGGGVLLVRFAPLFLQYPSILTILFALGVISAILGTTWKLLQVNIKNMLACSTLAQMGFMFVQCGLGLFPAAIAHIIYHGMFKAYLFLMSGSAAKDKRIESNAKLDLLSGSYALLFGVVGSLVFCYITDKSILHNDTSLVLIAVSFICTTQVSATALSFKTAVRIPIALLLSCSFGLIYGASVQAVALYLAPMNIMQPQTLNKIHVLGMLLFTAAWLSKLLLENAKIRQFFQGSLNKWYVIMLNASQPHAKTVTAYRTQYKF